MDVLQRAGSTSGAAEAGGAVVGAAVVGIAEVGATLEVAGVVRAATVGGPGVVAANYFYHGGGEGG